MQFQLEKKQLDYEYLQKLHAIRQQITEATPNTTAIINQTLSQAKPQAPDIQPASTHVAAAPKTQAKFATSPDLVTENDSKQDKPDWDRWLEDFLPSSSSVQSETRRQFRATKK